MSEQLSELIQKFLSKFDKDNEIRRINHEIGPVRPVFEYKGTLQVPSKPLFGYQINALFTKQRKEGEVFIGGSYVFNGGLSPLKQGQSNGLKIPIQGWFNKDPSSLKGILDFDLTILDGTYTLILLDKTLIIRGVFTGSLLGQKLSNNLVGSGTFKELLFFDLARIKENVESQKQIDPAFYHENKHILSLTTDNIYYSLANFEISSIRQITKFIPIYGYFQQVVTQFPFFKNYSFYADNSKPPHQPEHWPKIDNPLKLQGAFLQDPETISNSVGYSVITRDTNVYLSLFENKKLVGQFSGQGQRPVYLGEAWFQKGRK